MTSLAENLIPVKRVPVRTKYPKSVKVPSLNMLKRGKQNKKLGDVVSVKKWKGMTMYSLTLEERTTCPSDCEQWDNCYGNNMPFAHRFDHTHPDFKKLLGQQLEELSKKHPEGFVVRLHVLGDFFDGLYIAQWQIWLYEMENLNIFGYTHHKHTSTLGNMLQNLNRIYPDRCAIRFSDDEETGFSAYTHPEENDELEGLPMRKSKAHHRLILTEKEHKYVLVCPEQRGTTASCTTCGFCWTSKEPIVFIEH